MKKRLILPFLLIFLLICGCAREDGHPEWDAGWTRFGELLAAETPEGFRQGEYNDALAPNGIWYATFVSGEERTVLNESGIEASVYDAVIYLVLLETAKPESAVADWTEREGENYSLLNEREIGDFTAYSLKNGKNSVYSSGSAAFAAGEGCAISVELLCAEDYTGDADATLEAFIAGLHY